MEKYYFHAEKMPTMVRPIYIASSFDRTRTLFDCPDIKILSPLGVSSDVDFNDICDKRASEIVDIAAKQNKSIAVFWSGGIDSTVVITALRKHNIDKKLTVVLNDYSILEYPWYFEQLRRSEVTFCWVRREDTTDTLSSLLKFHIVITGEIGDQIFGSVKYKEFPDYSVLMHPWQSYIKVSSPEFMERYEKFVAKCPSPVKTIKEFWWWVSYAIKYQGVCFRTINTSWDAVLEENVFHFFNTPEFNNWSVTVPMEFKFFGTDERQYKWVAKEYIFKETKDSNYRDNKVKEVSLVTTLSASGKTSIKSVDTNWNKK